MKICTTCKEEKELTEFSKEGDYYRGMCRKCRTIYQAKYRRNHKEQSAAYSYKARAVHPDRAKARWAISSKIRSGKLDSSVYCEDCGLISTTQAHHEDYSKPLEIDWLCKTCHGLRHRKAVLVC